MSIGDMTWTEIEKSIHEYLVKPLELSVGYLLALCVSTAHYIESEVVLIKSGTMYCTYLKDSDSRITCAAVDPNIAIALGRLFLRYIDRVYEENSHE